MSACPACGDPYEYRATPEADRTTIRIDELCSADPDTRWTRICPTLEDDGDGAVLAVYHHHFGADDG